MTNTLLSEFHIQSYLANIDRDNLFTPGTDYLGVQRISIVSIKLKNRYGELGNIELEKLL